MLVLGLLVAAGCYEPDLRTCTVQCAASNDCAPGQLCGNDGWCALPSAIGACAPSDGGATVDALGDPRLGDGGTDGGISDGSLLADAALPPADAAGPTDGAPNPSPTCGSDCSGSCEQGVCVIRCTANNSCAGGVQCPAQGPCVVDCAGNNSCAGVVRCGAGRCSVACSGNNSCDDGVRCETACACDVSCTGNNACDVPAGCPGPAACDTSAGCTSLPAACNAC
ncbi:MAG: hypothetical protein H0X17_14170 [Deltaproteobacteria bacterium]|nr:hypothetical protein [Deltaproteobacteria bacterium]